MENLHFHADLRNDSRFRRVLILVLGLTLLMPIASSHGEGSAETPRCPSLRYGGSTSGEHVVVRSMRELRDALSRSDTRGRIVYSGPLPTRTELRDLKGKKLEYVRFFQSTATDATNFEGADLRRTCWTKTEAEGVDFSGADLTGASFEESNLSSATFTRSTLAGAVFEECTLNGAKFDSADLAGASMHECPVSGASFAAAKMQGFSYFCSLAWTSLTTPECGSSNVNFDNADLREASIQGLDDGSEESSVERLEERASFEGALLEGASLTLDLAPLSLRGKFSKLGLSNPSGYSNDSSEQEFTRREIEIIAKRFPLEAELPRPSFPCTEHPVNREICATPALVRLDLMSAALSNDASENAAARARKNCTPGPNLDSCIRGEFESFLSGKTSAGRRAPMGIGGLYVPEEVKSAWKDTETSSAELEKKVNTLLFLHGNSELRIKELEPGIIEASASAVGPNSHVCGLDNERLEWTGSAFQNEAAKTLASRKDDEEASEETLEKWDELRQEAVSINVIGPFLTLDAGRSYCGTHASFPDHYVKW